MILPIFPADSDYLLVLNLRSALKKLPLRSLFGLGEMNQELCFVMRKCTRKIRLRKATDFSTTHMRRLLRLHVHYIKASVI
jgi:hypothetical protein